MVKFKLLYFKHLLDYAFTEFCKNFNDSFLKDASGQYVLSKDFSDQKMLTEMQKYIERYLTENILSFDKFNPTYYLILGSCYPKDNLALKFKKVSYFPTKLQKLIESDFQVKYLLKEKDIKLDIIRFNNICQKLFNKYFKNRHIQKNLIFIQHKRLDCYALFKLLKNIYGKGNCDNYYEEKKFAEMKQPIIAVNELIDRYSNKLQVKTTSEFKLAMKEIQQYITERMSQI